MVKRLVSATIVALLVLSGIPGPAGPARAQSATIPCGIDLKVLVIAADGLEVGLPAIEDALNYVGVPFETYIASATPGGLTAEKLATGCRAKYQGVILTTGNLAYDAGGVFESALTPDEFAALAAYQARFSIRQVTWYTYPSPDLGFQWPTWPGGAADTSAIPLDARLTAAGAAVFPYLQAAAPISIKHAYTYLSQSLDADTTPLLVDDAGHALMALRSYADGRANLAMTFDSNPHLTHSILLSYGVVNWVTGGLFIGDRRVFVSPQIDDLFLHDAQWLAATPCGTNVDDTGAEHRMTGADLNAVVAWQRGLRQSPIAAGLRLTMAFNGAGTVSDYLTVGAGDALTGNVASSTTDTLTPTASRRQDSFHWVSHTYEHPNLDAIDYASATSQLLQNNAVATTLGLSRYSIMNLVQPEVSGLGNPEFLRAARDAGVRYLVSDTSKPGQGNPVPNVGRFSALQPELFIIPRHANNLFFNVAAPADWAAEYNCLYRGYWGRDLTYQEILENQSDLLVRFMFRGDNDPWMFHQTNLAAYDGTHTLLGDLLDMTLAKYSRHMNLPVQSPTMNSLGERMMNRTLAAMHGVQGWIEPGKGVWLTSPVDVKVPLTGVALSGAETYGGQPTSWIKLRAGRPTFVAWANTIGVKAPTASAGLPQAVNAGSVVTLAGAGTDANVPIRPLTYEWVQTRGPAVTINSADQPQATFVAPALAVGAANVELGFTLTVSNGTYSAMASTTVTVRAPRAPIVKATASNSSPRSGQQVSLIATATDPNVPALPLTYAWTQTSGPSVVLQNADQSTATFVAPLVPSGKATSLTFTVVVSNGLASVPASVRVSVRR